jgi:hypothetical protein
VRVAYCGENVVPDNLNGLKEILWMSFCLRFVCDWFYCYSIMSRSFCLLLYCLKITHVIIYWTFIGKGALWY